VSSNSTHFQFCTQPSKTRIPLKMAQHPDTQSPSGSYVTGQGRPAVLSNSTPSLLGRRWFSLRWHLSRTLFAKPLPFLTESLELKAGDLLITLPIAVFFIGVNALNASQAEVGGSGGAAAIIMILPFAFAVRNNSVLLTLTGISFERALFYHKFFGAVAWIVSGLHGLAYLLAVKSSKGRRLQTRPDESTSDTAASPSVFTVEFTGALTFYFLSALLFFSFYKIRRHFFELFLRFHWILFLLIIVFGVMHGAGLMLVGFAPWLLDLVFRFAVITPRNSRRIQPSQVSVAQVSRDIVRIQFPRNTGFHYEPGQYVFLCLPAIAWLEWHPFTIASAPHEPMVTLFIKVQGDWTKKLAAYVAKNPSSSSSMTVLLDGPYGALSVELDQYANVLFVSGGIGVTPMLSIANALYEERVDRVVPIQKAWFLWSVRERETIQALGLETSTHNPKSWILPVVASPGSSNSKAHDAFYTEFFLTTSSPDLTHPVDQQLANCLQYNRRPEIAKTLQELGQIALEGHRSTSKPARVAVLVCGPAAMVVDVIRQSMKVAKELNGRVVFDVHQETFDF
jgi:predicted ferric reductase